jgi:adenylate kinase
MKIILVGIQGSGKSTQGTLLSQNLGIPYLSTGHIFREMAKEVTPLGRQVKEIMTAGLLQPDDLTVQVVETYLKKPEYANGYIMDGFPRTLEQVEKFQNGVDKVICLNISDKEALVRLAYQNDGTRPDDSVAAIEKRIELFHQVTQPVIDYYKHKDMLVEVNGEQTIEVIHEQILRALGK